MFQEEFDNPTHIADYLDLVLKRKLTVILIFLLVVSIAAFYTWRAMPIYQSTATMIIDNEQSTSPITGQSMEYETYFSQSLTFNTHFELILSTDVIQRVIKALDLDKESSEDIKEKLEVSPIRELISKYKKNIKLLFKGEDAPPLTPQEKFNGLVSSLRSKIAIKDVEETRLLKISVKDKDPEQAALIANTLAKQYIEFNLSNRMNSSKDTLEWMNNELYGLKKRLEDDEKKFFEFKQANKVFSITGKQKMMDQKISEFNTNYLQARNKRLDLDTQISALEKQFTGRNRFASIRSLISNETIETVYNRVRELEIEYARLSKVYKSKHPKIVQITDELARNRAMLQDELQKELASLKSERSVLYAREQVLKNTIDEFEKDALDTSSNELEYSMLQRNLNTSQQLYDTLLAKVKESDIVKSSDSSNIRVVEEAVVPSAPVAPNKKRNMQLALVVGLILGVLTAFFLEYMDQTIRTEDDIDKYIGLPVLSIVPVADESTTYGSKKQT